MSSRTGFESPWVSGTFVGMVAGGITLVTQLWMRGDLDGGPPELKAAIHRVEMAQRTSLTACPERQLALLPDQLERLNESCRAALTEILAANSELLALFEHK